MNLNKFIEKMINNMSNEMKVAVISGCKLEHEYKDGKYTVKTKNKVGFIRDNKKNIIEVIENPNA